MDWQAATFGLLLGFGAIITWRGFQVVINKDLPEQTRKKAMWQLNGGIALMAVSMFMVMRLVGEAG